MDTQNANEHRTPMHPPRGRFSQGPRGHQSRHGNCGQQVVTADGDILRPDCMLIEDPSDKQTAASATMTQHRYETLMGDVLGMAGPTNRPAAGP